MGKKKEYFDPIDAALVRSNERDWIDSGTGNLFKVMRISKETGAWSALIKAPAGQVNAPHTHLGPADFYVLKGCIEYRGGVAKAGHFAREPLGAVHEHTSFPEETLYLFTSYGALAMYGPDGNVVAVTDAQLMQALAES